MNVSILHTIRQPITAEQVTGIYETILKDDTIPLHDWKKDEIRPHLEICPIDVFDFPHRHTFCALYFVTYGEGTLHIDFHNHEVKADRLYFIAPYQVQYWQARTPITGCVVYFDYELIKDLPKNHQSIFDALFYSNSTRPPYLSLEGCQKTEAVELFENMAAEYRANDLASFSIIRLYLHVLLLKIERFSCLPCVSAESRTSIAIERVRRFTNLVSKNFTNKHLPSDYANLMGVALGHLAANTRAILGLSPSEVIHQTLITEAKRLLAFTERSASEISYALGFDDPSYFGRFFKRRTGTNPRKFRLLSREKYANLQL